MLIPIFNSTIQHNVQLVIMLNTIDSGKTRGTLRVRLEELGTRVYLHLLATEFDLASHFLDKAKQSCE